MNLPIELMLAIYDSSCWVTRLKIRMTCKICKNFPLHTDQTLEKSWIDSFKESYNKYGIKYYQFRKFMYYPNKKHKNCDDRCCNDYCSVNLPYKLQILTNEINLIRQDIHARFEKGNYKEIQKEIQKEIEKEIENIPLHP